MLTSHCAQSWSCSGREVGRSGQPQDPFPVCLPTIPFLIDGTNSWMCKGTRLQWLFKVGDCKLWPAGWTWAVFALTTSYKFLKDWKNLHYFCDVWKNIWSSNYSVHSAFLELATSTPFRAACGSEGQRWSRAALTENTWLHSQQGSHLALAKRTSNTRFSLLLRLFHGRQMWTAWGLGCAAETAGTPSAHTLPRAGASSSSTPPERH